MSVYSIFQLFGGLAFFLYGMSTMSSSLEKMAGGSLETTLKKVTSNKVLSFLLGTLITVAIQSSSGVMVMLIGLVNSGIINFADTFPIILGTNVGTTVTAWVLTLMGVSSDKFSLMSLLNPKYFSPLLAFIGIVLRMTAKKEKKKDVGNILIGFAILMYGMSFMSDAMRGLSDMPQFTTILTMFSSPLLAVLVSTIFTGIIQSSAATIGIIQTLASTSGAITYQMAIPLMLGANIGTCVTALLSSMGASKNAKRVSVTAIVINTFGAIVVLAAMILGQGLLKNVLSQPATSVAVALSHTLFNLLNTLLVIIFYKLILAIVKALVRSDNEQPEFLIDERLLARPSIAVNEAYGHTLEMAMLAKETFESALECIANYSEEAYEKTDKGERMMDWYEDELNTFLVSLSRMALSDAASSEVNKMMHVINDFERIGDHAINISKIAQSMNEKKIEFSDSAKKDLVNIKNALNEIVSNSIEAFVNDDEEKADLIEPLEEVIDIMISDLINKHIKRVMDGKCTVELGFMYNEFLNNCERVSDHCSNIAVCVIEVDSNELSAHRYLKSVKRNSDQFKILFEGYKKKYNVD